MKRLFLIRHAKSSWDHPGLDDIERPLNKRGKRDAPFMGSRLKKFNINPDMIYTSPAKRARKTAKQIALNIGYPVEKIEQHAGIYTSDMNRLLLLVQETENSIDTLFLVGHNYVLTDFAEYLTGEVFGNIPTCGIVGVAFPIESWREVHQEKGEMLFFDYPKKHRHEGDV
ncbi:SixA phosphatase family protein [Desulfosediminicola flagellatus]|uniref:SixA phosphatase family protein n=1 Tax=Desulfosediminicola flagellatus TaxID=2569541 RepID=UPI0010ABB76F|nr:histidine phosphatase family protein [Desulfosediminicola flagellatus]